MGTQQKFGGDWTEEKLARVKAYLEAYSIALSKQPFQLIYVDAFAGTGFREQLQQNSDNELSLQIIEEEKEVSRFHDGSARIALKINRPFDRYIFVEKDVSKANELQKLKQDFPNLASRIEIHPEDANQFLQTLCSGWKRNHRGVIFLDPFGMEVEWTTLEKIAQTECIDLWLLFPLGSAVNRLLKRDGNIVDSHRTKLDRMFGTQEWFDTFYTPTTTPTLFGFDEGYSKSRMEDIGNYFIKRLKTIFIGVADNPLVLRNSKNNPLFLLCFAVSNPKGKKLALDIAQYILEPKNVKNRN